MTTLAMPDREPAIMLRVGELADDAQHRARLLHRFEREFHMRRAPGASAETQAE
ncbi:MAG TPA: hypothetical protein VF573_13195 [Paraburkholderia sp.]|uniref:hypothetical protein n=1 Tax=Paraburkholderia sp. TaxID=1926495 RepID=UPI002ED5BABA